MVEKYDEDKKIVYQIYAEDIRYSKKQQWLTIYYGLLVQSGIITYSKNVKFSYANFLLVSASIFVAILVTTILMKYQSQIINYRYKIDRYIKPLLALEVLKALDKPNDTESNNVKNFFNEFFDSFLIIFIFMAWGGTAFVLCSICQPATGMQFLNLILSVFAFGLGYTLNLYIFEERNFNKELRGHLEYTKQLECDKK